MGWLPLGGRLQYFCLLPFYFLLLFKLSLTRCGGFVCDQCRNEQHGSGLLARPIGARKRWSEGQKIVLQHEYLCFAYNEKLERTTKTGFDDSPSTAAAAGGSARCCGGTGVGAGTIDSGHLRSRRGSG